jgi:hypothetical protein
VTNDVDFVWHPGFSSAQKERNRVAMHAAANDAGYTNVLEVSSKSNVPLGFELSAFKLLVSVQGVGEIPVECAFQGSKVYKGYGASSDLYDKDPRTAKREAAMRNQNDLAWFQLEGMKWSLTPRTLFYDWVYLRALADLPRMALDQLTTFDAFTDIEFNPAKSINCQARSCALAVSLILTGKFERAVESAQSYKSIILGIESDDDQLRQRHLL